MIVGLLLRILYEVTHDEHEAQSGSKRLLEPLISLFCAIHIPTIQECIVSIV